MEEKMSDNKMKKWLDGKRIALSQSYERKYIKKCAKDFLAKWKTQEQVTIAESTMTRMMKALIKLL